MNYTKLIFLSLLYFTLSSSTMGAYSALTIKTNRKSYQSQEKIKVIFSSFPGNYDPKKGGDWISLARQNSSSKAYLQWTWTKGKLYGAHTFKGLPPGKYEARAYYNWPKGKYKIMGRYSFTVSPAKKSKPTPIPPSKKKKHRLP